MKYFLQLFCILIYSSVLAEPTPPPPDPDPAPPTIGSAEQPLPRGMLYRADFRHPSDIFRTGFTPRGTATSVFDHVRGATPYGQGRSANEQSAYVAATPFRNVAFRIGDLNNSAREDVGAGIEDPNNGPLELYIYEIRATEDWHSVRPAFIRQANTYLNRTDLTTAQEMGMTRLVVNEMLTEEWVSSEVVLPNTIRRAWRVSFTSSRDHQDAIDYDWTNPANIIINTNYLHSQTQSSTDILAEQGASSVRDHTWLGNWQGRLSAAWVACCCAIWKHNNHHTRALDEEDPVYSEAYLKYCGPQDHYLPTSNIPSKFNGFKLSFGKEIISSIINFGYSDKAWVDFNGDGRKDHCAIGQSRVGKQAILCAIQHDGGKFKMIDAIHLDDYGWPDLRYWIDINGDGKTDYCRMVTLWTHLKCAISTGYGFDKQIQSSYINQGFWHSPADVNGDGAMDYCRLLVEHDEILMRCLLADPSKPSGFGDDIGYRDVGPHGLTDADYGDNSDNNRVWVDVDGDEKADFCRFIRGQLSIRCNLMRSTSQDGWVRVESVLYFASGWPDQRWWVDYNANGKTDYCRKYEHAYGRKIACLEISKDLSEFNDYSPYQWAELSGPGEVAWVDLTASKTRDICILMPDSKKMACQMYSRSQKKWVQEYKTKPGIFLGSSNFNAGDVQILTNNEPISYFCRINPLGVMSCLEIISIPECSIFY